MKKASRAKAGKTADVQRAAVQRSQHAGKRQATRESRRLGPSPVRRAPRAKLAEAAPAEIAMPFGLRRAFVVVILAVALGLIGLVVAQNWQGLQALKLSGAANTPQPATNPGEAAPSGRAIRVGIVSGHQGNDSGTVCTDGVTEAQVNFDHALRAASLLRAQGYTVDILDEFDARLKGYVADVLLSIHADSCAYINELATGFKVARVLDSRLPEAEDRLVACLTARYKAATGLRFHANTVTYDMTKYHAFYEIDPNTPAAIIETGFMNLDRAVLTRKADRVAQGIVDGIQCYLNEEEP